MNKDNIVFICGALRSGTTMLHLMLNGHPYIKNTGEFDFLFDYMMQDGKLPDTEIFCDILKIDRIFNEKNLTIDQALDSKSLVISFVEQLANENNILTLNVHRHFDRIPHIFPSAKIVHLIRDPRDVARSCIGMGWAGNVYFGVDYWIDTEKSWDRLEKNLLTEQYITLYYEDLIAKPEAELTRLCQFIGVPYSSSMLDYDNYTTYAKPNNELIRQWATTLKPNEIMLVESKAITLMQARKFELSGYSIEHPDALTKIILNLKNKIFKFKHGINRYGWRLYCLEKLAKLINMDSLHRKCIQQKNQIDIKYLK